MLPSHFTPTSLQGRHHKDFNSFHRGFASRMSGGGGSSRMSPLNGFPGRYGGPGRNFHHYPNLHQPHHHHHHQQHQRLSQDSFSGWSTPDNHSFVSLSHYGGEGLHSPDVPGEQEDVLDRLTPSEADSSYIRHPPSTVSGVPHSSRIWSYLQDNHHNHHPVGLPRSPPYPGGPPSPPSSSSAATPGQPHDYYDPILTPPPNSAHNTSFFTEERCSRTSTHQRRQQCWMTCQMVVI